MNTPDNHEDNLASEAVFLGITVFSFLMAIASSFVVPLLTTRPLLFGIFLGCLVHKWMGGVDKGEITDLKSAIGNIKLQGPAAAIIISTGMLSILYAATPDSRVEITKPKNDEKLVILNPSSGMPTMIEAVSVGKAQGLRDRVTSDKDYDGVFSLFMELCIPKSEDGCKISATIRSASDVPDGQARICSRWRTPIEIPILVNTIIADKKGGEAVPLILHNYRKQCATRNTIFVSPDDAKSYHLNLGEGEKGYYLPNIGVTTSPS